MWSCKVVLELGFVDDLYGLEMFRWCSILCVDVDSFDFCFSHRSHEVFKDFCYDVNGSISFSVCVVKFFS